MMDGKTYTYHGDRDAARDAAVAAGVETIDGKDYMRDARGSLVPLSAVRPMDKLQDELVRKMMFFAQTLSAQIGRFKGHCFDDVGAFQALIAQEYGATVGGKKGNIQLLSLDGRLKVQVQVADHITFGPELQAAKSLVDVCLNEWTADANDYVRAIVTRAFQVDKEGRINRAELYQLMRIDIADERWKQAMNALRDSIRVIGSKTYMRFYRRETPEAAWQPVSIDLAAVGS